LDSQLLYHTSSQQKYRCWFAKAVADDVKAKCVLAREAQSSAFSVNADVTTLPPSSGCASSDLSTSSLKAKAFNTVTELVQTAHFVCSVWCTINKSWEAVFEDFHNKLRYNTTLVFIWGSWREGQPSFKFKNGILLQLPIDFKIRRHYVSKGSLACSAAENRKYN